MVEEDEGIIPLFEIPPAPAETAPGADNDVAVAVAVAVAVNDDENDNEAGGLSLGLRRLVNDELFLLIR